jgi:hypothetical protein
VLIVISMSYGTHGLDPPCTAEDCLVHTGDTAESLLVP